jgi:bilirubin oxidase
MQDHEMMGAFNVSLLNDFGYNETTHFIDPMEDRYRAVPIKSGEWNSVDSWGSGDFSYDGVKAKADWFVGLEAYENVDAIEDALIAYYATQTNGGATTPTTLTTTTSATSATTSATLTTTSATSSKTTLTTLTTTTKATLTSSTTSDDKKKTTTTTSTKR